MDLVPTVVDAEVSIERTPVDIELLGFLGPDMSKKCRAPKGHGHMRRLASSPMLWSAEGAQPIGKGRARRATLIGKFWFGV